MEYLKLNDLYKQKSLAINGKQDHIPFVELKIDIIENEIIGILQKPHDTRTNEEKEILRIAKFYYSNLFKYNPKLAISVKLYRNRIKDAFFANSNIDEINAFTSNVAKSAKNIYDKFMNDSVLSDDEQIIMFEFFSVNIGTKSKSIYNAQKNVICKLLLKQDNYHITGKNFYLQFITHEKCQRLGIDDAIVYVGNTDIHGNSHADSFGLSYSTTGIISINQNFVKHKPNDIYNEAGVSYDVKISQTMHHELEHYYQMYKLRNNVVNKSTFDAVRIQIVFRRHLSDSDYDEYMENYKFNEMEREANIRGWYDSVKFFEKYGGEKRIKDISRATHMELTTSFEKGMGVKKDKNNAIFSTEKYNISKLIEVVANNPELVSNYVQLQPIFNIDGKIKGFSQLLSEYTDLFMNKNVDSVVKIDRLGVYDEFFDYLFGRNDLSKLPLEKYSYDQQTMIFILIKDSFERECRNLKNIMSVYPFVNNIFFDVYAKNRLERIKKYYNYLSTNQEYIKKLSDYSYIKTFGLLSINNLNRSLESFEDRINKDNRYLQGTTYGEEIKNLSKLMGEEEYGRIYGQGKSR